MGHHVVGELIGHMKVVEDVAALIGQLTPARRHAGNRVCVLEGPAEFVHAMDGLLHEPITAQQEKLYQLRTCHSTSLHSGLRAEASGMGFTGPV